MKNRLILVVLASCLASLTVGCVQESTGVGVHAVNYTEDEFTYSLNDPVDAKNFVGGEGIGSYGAGGIVCCYAIPAKWEPGHKVSLKAEIWFQSLPKGPNGTVVKTEKMMLDLPKSETGKPSELWVVRHASGEFELVASSVDPNHEKWPGKVKGWPVASAQYRQKMIRKELADAEETLQLFEEAQIEMKKDPIGFAKERWRLDKEYGKPDELAAYSGPSDEKYLTHLRMLTDEMIVTSRAQIAAFKKELR
jgi:hypothetical protein